ncbi:MAG: outer membrane lipoprotein carrier protein LolA [Holophagaceae bacterium]|nr:outer membrane lipoprotein carrier protein LolA [Holophagaceae bacterium]
MNKFLMRSLRLLPIPLCCTFLNGQIPGIKTILEKFDVAQAKTETLQAPYTLSIKRAMLRAPSTTKGSFYLSGSDLAHFVFAAPDDLVIHITDKAFISYSPQEKKGERMETGLVKKVNRKSLGLASQLSYYSDFFKFEASEAKDLPGTLLVTLIPRSISFKKKLEKIEVWLDRETYLPKRLNWVERGGDSWLMELGSLQINKTIPASILNFAVPTGTPMHSEFNFFSTKKK